MTFSSSSGQVWIVAVVSLLVGCIEFKDKDSAKKDTPAAVSSAPLPADSADVSAPSYEAASLDTAGLGSRFMSTAADDSVYGRISGKTADARPTRFPMRVPKRGALALQLQVMLDRAHFSPGLIDGLWGENATKALAFFKSPDSPDSSAASVSDSIVTIDQATYARLKSAADSRSVVTEYTVTADDVKGPFTNIPDNVYEQGKLHCLCYTSAAEGIAEKFHTSQKLIAQLNPTATLGNLATGTVLIVPNVDVETVPQSTISSPKFDTASAMSTGQIARLVISRKGFWTHAVDASGKILYHFPSTLGGGYDPSPTGEFHVTNITWNPAFHYQPTLFAEVPDKKPEAHLPKGPNSPVGVVWLALSKAHYGIHGTSAPETIGYANSHGCVRLTNWDATELGRLIGAGTPVQFQ